MSLSAGNNYLRQGQYDKAIAEYEKVKHCDVLGDTARFNLDLIAEKTNRSAANENNPLLSIVMPVFNVGPYLDASILSVLNQGFTDFELIIVNDASTDNSKKIIDMHASQDARIKAIHLDFNTLGGAGIPSNIGIKHAKGKYIGFVDSDDWITPNALAELVNCAEQHSAEIVVGDFCTFHEDDRSVAKSYDSASWQGIPIGEVLSAKEYPQVFRISPVPWRKLYRADFLKSKEILYPEGDYFYEDNPLHWFVLSQTEKMVFSEKVISYHRMAREGQTMDASTYKLSAICSHLNTIASKVICQAPKVDKNVAREFYDYWYRCDWVAARQSDKRVANLIRKQMSIIYNKCKDVIEPISDRANFANRVKQCTAAYQDIDLTVVIPSYNCEKFIRSTIQSVLAIKNISVNVLVIDDGSTDSTVDIVKKIEKEDERVFLFQQNNRGAGRARNSIIPLCTGEYTYFLDADDYIYPDALERSVIAAKKKQHDLMFFKYRIEFYEENKSRGMYNADVELWKKLNTSNGHKARKNIVAGLINYPWNRIIKTRLLLDDNIFFGGSVVHNDIPYHWHSIAAAQNIAHKNEEVCVHRKFSNREQITNISDSRRMMVFSALEYTSEKLKQYSVPTEIESIWQEFGVSLLKWARTRIPEELSEDFSNKEIAFLSKN